ncbi:MAG: baseplate J/gp47 family protein [Sodalis sp. (in: enterobacteria)]|uniref:baseplate J/gp47 family protein n=1 Tax=Sodalis sp. (in: enterobacteria) TaxID=1898979 RepID=UPI003F3B5FAD
MDSAENVPGTADHDYLVMHACTRNLPSKKAATPAGGEVRLTSNPGANITGLLQLRPTGSRQRYQTTAPGTIDAGQPDLAHPRAVKRYPGQSGGQYARDALMAPASVDSNVTVTRMVGGSEAGSDAALLVRLLKVIRRPSAGGNQYDYHRWAVSLPGVTEAHGYPLRRGYGTG